MEVGGTDRGGLVVEGFVSKVVGLSVNEKTVCPTIDCVVVSSIIGFKVVPVGAVNISS